MSQSAEETLAVLTSRIDQALSERLNGEPQAERELGRLNVSLRKLSRTTDVEALRSRINDERARVRAALGMPRQQRT